MYVLIETLTLANPSLENPMKIMQSQQTKRIDHISIDNELSESEDEHKEEEDKQDDNQEDEQGKPMIVSKDDTSGTEK
jgi:hypothetical protein